METITKVSQLKNALTSEKLTESNIKEEWAISWLTTEKACFLIQTKINVNDEWLTIGNTEIKEFKNSEENLKLIKNDVPEPFLSAVLAVWEAPEESGKLIKSEVPLDEPRKN